MATATAKTTTDKRASLTAKLATAQTILHRCENSIGRGHDIRRMVRLRDEIARLRQRLEKSAE